MFCQYLWLWRWSPKIGHTYTRLHRTLKNILRKTFSRSDDWPSLHWPLSTFLFAVSSFLNLWFLLVQLKINRKIGAYRRKVRFFLFSIQQFFISINLIKLLQGPIRQAVWFVSRTTKERVCPGWTTFLVYFKSDFLIFLPFFSTPFTHTQPGLSSHFDPHSPKIDPSGFPS